MARIPSPTHRSSAGTARVSAFALLLALAGCAGEGAPASAPPGPPVPDVFVRFHLVEESAAPGLETHVFEGETLRLDPRILASDPEMQRPRLVPEGGRWALDLRFTADGGVTFDQAALDLHGRRVAVVVESQVIRVATIRPQFGAGRLLVELPLSESEAARMEEAIARRWP